MILRNEWVMIFGRFYHFCVVREKRVTNFYTDGKLTDTNKDASNVLLILSAVMISLSLIFRGLVLMGVFK